MEISLEQYNKMAERLTELEYLLAERQWIPCSACVHYTSFGNGCGTCAIHATKTSFERMCNDNDFCSWAERKCKE